jgi:hypothetical protein
MKIKAAIFSLATILVSLVLSLVVLEYVVRWAIPAYDPSGRIAFIDGAEASKIVGYPVPVLGRPNTVQRQIKNTGDFDVEVSFNKYGFRDDRDVADIRPDDYVVVGDSVSFGWGVEEKDRVSERLEPMIGQRVFNISLPVGILDTEKLIAYASSRGAQIKRLIFILSTENRLIEAVDVSHPSQAVLPTKLPAELLQAKKFLMENSATYFLVTSLIHRNPTLKDIAVRAGLIFPAQEAIIDKPYDAAAVTATADYLAQMSQRYEMLLVVVPSRGIWFGHTQAEALKTHEELISALIAHRIDVMDLKKLYDSYPDPLSVYFPNDGHWRPEIHGAAAGEISRHIKSKP